MENQVKKKQHLSEIALRNKRKYTCEWARKNTIVVTVQLRIGKDDDIINLLNKQQNRNGFIKGLLRKHLEK